jgi:2-hydroxychromene-2-carboxylate isomerase
MELVIYGDFNCPFSALASERAARLEALGVSVDWRAVQHDPSRPAAGRPIDAVTRTELEHEIETVRDQLGPDESITLHPPTTLINTAAISRTYAAVAPEDRPSLRQRLFRAYWRDGTDISRPDYVAGLPDPTDGTDTAERWQAELTALDQPIVPAMLLPDGRVSRGLGVLARLTEHLAERPPHLT